MLVEVFEMNYRQQMHNVESRARGSGYDVCGVGRGTTSLLRQVRLAISRAEVQLWSHPRIPGIQGPSHSTMGN